MIVCNHIEKTYAQHHIFSDFFCTFPEGKISCLMGRSGRGKTTLLRMILGLEQPDKGSIDGLEGKTIRAVFQEDRLLMDFTVRENLRFVCKNAQEVSKISYILSQMMLSEWEYQKVSVLSGGMQRRVAIARALLVPWDILILDEPFRGLDMQTKQKIIQVVLQETKGKTVLISTHDESDVSALYAEVFYI